tara:strand:- start:473 stop:688 length:216 start_codon:yes stop_codon:yes gene_type:complete
MYLLGKEVFYAVKRNLFKDQAAWSGKDIKIKYSNKETVINSKGTNNFLKTIANESKFYLEDQYKKAKNETK